MDKFTLSKEETVLLVIDIQERLVQAIKYGEQVVNNTNTLMVTAAELKIPILLTEQYPKGLGKTVPELCANLAAASTYEKITFSGWIPELVSNLRQLARKKVIVTGMKTHVCVFQTVRDLLAHGYDVFVVGDGVCSRREESHQNGLSLISSMGAVVTNTETVFFDLMKKAGTPQFKELSKLIK